VKTFAGQIQVDGGERGSITAKFFFQDNMVSKSLYNLYMYI